MHLLSQNGIICCHWDSLDSSPRCPQVKLKHEIIIFTTPFLAGRQLQINERLPALFITYGIMHKLWVVICEHYYHTDQ